MQLVLLALQIVEEAAHARELAVAFDDAAAGRSGSSSCQGTSSGMPRLRGRSASSRSHSGRYLGLVQGSMAPSASVLRLVGDHQVQIEVDGVAEALAARAGAVRVVEREQARLGLFVAKIAALALEALREAQAAAASRLRAARSRRSLRRPRDSRSRPHPRCARARRRETAMRSTSTNTGSAKLTSSSDSGVENSKTCAILIQAVEAALAQLEQPRFQQLLVCGASAAFFVACRAPLGFGLAPDAPERCCSGKSTCSRVPSPQREDGVGDFVHRVLLHLLRRTAGSRCGPRARRAGADSRRSRWPWPRWSAGCGWCSSAGWRRPGRCRRSHRRPASRCAPGTAARRRRATPRSGAGPRRRWCRRRATTCPSPKPRSPPSWCCAESRSRCS